MTTLATGELLIGDHNWVEHYRPKVNGVQVRGGLVPRNLKTHPPLSSPHAVPFEALDIPLIPDSEWAQRCTDMEAAKGRISDLRMIGNAGQMVPSVDQNGRGYCWAHSSTTSVIATRLLNGDPYVGLSAYAVACIIKNYADEGGWGAESMDFICKRGVPSYAFWPAQSTDSSCDNAKTWENAALHKVLGGWIDLAKEEYDRNLTWQQEISLLLSRNPVVKDENWWSHSICGIDPVNGATHRNTTRGDNGKLLSLEAFERAWGMNHPITRGFGVRIWNSWGNDWSDHGMGVLAGDKAISDGSVAPRVVPASLV